MDLHIMKVMNNLTLSILMRCSHFASVIGLGNPLNYMSNDAELRKKDSKMVEVLDKPCAFTWGLRTPRREKLIGPFSLPRVPDEGKFSEAWNVIRNLQRTTSVEPPSFAKETTKFSEDSPKSAVNPLGRAPKDPKKRGRSFLSLKSSTMRTREQAQNSNRKSFEPKKADPSMVLKGSKEATGSFPK